MEKQDDDMPSTIARTYARRFRPSFPNLSRDRNPWLLVPRAVLRFRALYLQPSLERSLQYYRHHWSQWLHGSRRMAAGSQGRSHLHLPVVWSMLTSPLSSTVVCITSHLPNEFDTNPTEYPCATQSHEKSCTDAAREISQML